MTLKPDGRDLKIIAFHLGKVATGLSAVMAVPALVALALREWNAASALLTGASIALVLGRAAQAWLWTRAPLTWAQGTVVVALAWLVGPLLLAVPLLLSGHLGTWLDAWFEAMSGLTTSGLSLVQDLDHLPQSLALYRHLTHFAGGQGIVIVVLSLLAVGGGQIGTLYVAEGREERIVPSVIRTSRFIFRVAGTYLVIGTLALGAALYTAGFRGWRLWWHAVNLFMAAFDTGGFAPMSTSIAYYHSMTVELVLFVLMLAGTISFGLHYHLWRRDHQELVRNLEIRTIMVTLGALTLVVLAGLAVAGTQTTSSGLVRKGFFTLFSAHSGTGFAVTNGATYGSDWGVLAPAAVVAAMALGGMAGSTAGGIKAIRIGLTVKGAVQDVRRLLLPESAMVVASYHAGGGRRVLRDRTLRAATTLLLLYVVTYLAGAGVGLLYGRWEITETLFESVSAAANVGLSVGIVDPAMPNGLKLTYLLQMWLGRLEFSAAFALLGYAGSLALWRK
jgi:trk system potassium uptake protein